MKKILTVLLAFLILIGIIGAGVYFWYNNQLDKIPSNDTTQVEIEIEKGESVQQIATKLETAGIIQNADIFYVYVKLNNLGKEIQAGKFMIPRNLNVPQVADSIQKAAGNDIWVTIPEGLRLDEIASKLEEAFLKEENSEFEKEKFIDIVTNPNKYELESEILKYKEEGKSLEGFLFPDTYNVAKDISTIKIVDLLTSTLENKIKSEELNLESHPYLKPYEVMTLASIIEREARNREDRFMISDILLKRLKGEMEGVKLLQVDATLLYEEKDWDAVITKQLKEKDSLYNTYKTAGLPPTPICSPGLESINAALNPKSNKYFFYLHDDEGQIHYAKTSKEHTNNVRCFINKNKDYCL